MQNHKELDVDLDGILSPDAVADPYTFLGRLRETDPVHWNERYRSWVLTRHDDVASAMSDLRFSSDRIAPVIARERRKQRPDLDIVETLELLDGWLVFRNPPEHTRFRRLVQKAFSPRILAGMRSEVEQTADHLLDEARVRAGDDGVIDLIREVAYPLPAIVIASMLGVPREDRDLFKGWSDDISALVFGAMEDPSRHKRAQTGMAELVRYIGALLDKVRSEPGDDLASALVAARDGDEALSHEELTAICVNLLFGGHETTTNLIANSVLALIRFPDQAAIIRDGDPAQLNTAIEELLRYDGPAKAVVRIAAEDVDMRGKTIRSGDRVFLMLSGANHDPEVFNGPNVLDLRRGQGSHLSFGIGVHYCLGATLARLEASIVIPRILQRFPSIALADPDLHWDPVILTRGLKQLKVRIDGA
ncbi:MULTISPECIES: cytochrome P450 [unclassified Dietzia]|uniref:cytochrome P450 n=1 Tax=unclassified Dietzia TaxID=2617939 RepID=UPI000D21386D|nr:MULTISPECIES: cytochrome P450 [unclassified Dietzia]AVZ40274.1 cytochrome P450 [Dietzia sp. JS16-p6b]QGW25746.1 cytochrome P450 [Dietzia sp. DQ12-45-1b]